MYPPLYGDECGWSQYCGGWCSCSWSGQLDPRIFLNLISWISFSCIDGFTTPHCFMFCKVTLCWELAACTPTAKWITPKANRIFEGSKARSISCNPSTDTDGGHAHIIGRSMCQFGLPPVPKQSTIVLDPSTGLCRKKNLGFQHYLVDNLHGWPQDNKWPRFSCSDLGNMAAMKHNDANERTHCKN